MKTEFELETANGSNIVLAGKVSIIGQEPKSSPYLTFQSIEGKYYFVQDKDLERFAVNILKAINSKKLKS